LSQVIKTIDELRRLPDAAALASTK
jgi:hypothetical protein